MPWHSDDTVGCRYTPRGHQRAAGCAGICPVGPVRLCAGSKVSNLRESLNRSTPSVSQTLPKRTAERPPLAADPAQLGSTADHVLSTARTAGLSDPVAITPGNGEAWVVKQVRRSSPEKQDAVSVDPTTGAIVDEPLRRLAASGEAGALGHRRAHGPRCSLRGLLPHCTSRDLRAAPSVRRLAQVPVRTI